QYTLSYGQPINSVLDGVLLLHAAPSSGSHLVVKLLIEESADVNASRLPRNYSDRRCDTSAPVVGSSGHTPLCSLERPKEHSSHTTFTWSPHGPC
ncbi:hypothetical protein PILCRDRAFT_79550, partial [Piloderma croceum F 1598]